MKFELPLTKRQKDKILNKLDSFNTAKGFGQILLFYIMLPLTNIIMIEAITGVMVIGLICFWADISIAEASLYEIGSTIVMIAVFFGLKYFWYFLFGKLKDPGNTEKRYLMAHEMKCIIIDSSGISSDKEQVRNSYVGRKRMGGYLLSRSFSFELNGERISSDDDNRCMIIGNTAGKILEGNREHLGVIFGKKFVILIAASLIDERYQKMTFDELKELANITKDESIDDVYIDNYIKNTKFRTALRSGRKMDNDEKRSYAFKIYKQFYNDNENRSMFMEIIKRGKEFFADFISQCVFVGVMYLLFGKRARTLLYEISYLYTGGSMLAQSIIGLCFAMLFILIAYEIYYYFIRNDVAGGILKSKECIEIHGRLYFADGTVDSGSITDEYILETDGGDILSGIRERDDLYIYPGLADDRVIVISSDRMIAIYPEGYFI